MLAHAFRVGESLLVLILVACLLPLLGWGGWAIVDCRKWNLSWQCKQGNPCKDLTNRLKAFL